MSPEQFCAWAEAAFGKYLPLMKLEVVKWLEPRTSWFIAGMRMVALEGHPSVYGKPPGVYELEQFKVKAYERGHTLEAIAAANRTTTLLATDSAEDFVTPEEGARRFAELREKLGAGSSTPPAPISPAAEKDDVFADEETGGPDA